MRGGMRGCPRSPRRAQKTHEGFPRGREAASEVEGTHRPGFELEFSHSPH